jgi:5-methyltetrahydropteroyltriglutamate--homocysteine methyltransferase
MTIPLVDQPGNLVRATIVGSLPKPSWLCGPGEMFANWRLAGATLEEGQEDAVRVWIADQEKSGLDVVTDGEQRRRHYIWGFFEGLEGIDTINLGKRMQRGGRYHKEISAARMVGEPEWRGPIFADAMRATGRMTDKPVKVTLPGPMTIVDSLIDTIGGRSEEQLALRFAELLNREALSLQEAGAAVIQFDEPAFNVYVDKVKDWGIAALERAAQDVAVTKAVHICYGYGTADVKRWKSANTDWSHYEATLPLLAKSTIDQVSVETAASGVDVSVISALRGKDVLLGCVDVGSETVESAETVAGRLRAALRHAEPGHLFACTDCGMMPLSRRAAEGKLRALASGAALVNATM